MKTTFLLLVLIASALNVWALQSPRDSSLQSNSTMGTASVRLAWDDPQAGNSYTLFYGKSSYPMTSSLSTPVGVKTVLVSGLAARTTYQFYVVARNSAGLVSGPSNILVYRTPRKYFGDSSSIPASRLVPLPNRAQRQSGLKPTLQLRAVANGQAAPDVR